MSTEELKKGPHKNYTALLLLLFSALILTGSILFTIAQLRVVNSSDYRNASSLGNKDMIDARNYLIGAYILGYVSVGIGILLAILYFWGGGLYEQPEFIHMTVFIILAILIIISGILGFIALSKINSSVVTDKQSASQWIWGAEVVGIIGLVVLFISGIWRAAHVSNKLSEPTTTLTVNTRSTSVQTTPLVSSLPAPAREASTSPVVRQEETGSRRLDCPPCPPCRQLEESVLPSIET